MHAYNILIITSLQYSSDMGHRLSGVRNHWGPTFNLWDTRTDVNLSFS